MASSDRIDELRKKFEENPRRYFAPLANEYRKAGDVEQAIAICRDYLPQQPGHMSGHIVYGQALYEGRQFEEAKTVFETALSLDPENLIALRHLGDIALILGDTEGARSWYGRVLEADPRNEEIQAQLKSLESIAPPVASDAAAAPEQPPESQRTAESPTPASPPAITSPAQSAPTVVVTAMKVPQVERTVEQAAFRMPEPAALPPIETLGTAPTAEITLDNVPVPAIPELAKLTEPFALPTPAPAMTVGFEPTSAPTDAPPAIEPLVLDTPAAPASETPAIDSFTLEGLETTSMSAPASTAGPEHTPAADGGSADIAAIDDVQIDAPGEADRGIEATVFDLPKADGPVVEPPKADLDVPTAEAEAPDAMLPASADLPPAADPTADLPMLDMGDDSSPTAGSRQAEPGPFVTETMAELYLSQGHRDEALRVYRALMEQRPDDAQLRAKFERMQRDSGPTIRELLSMVARRRPASAASAVVSTDNGSTEASRSVAAAPEALAPQPAQPSEATGRAEPTVQPSRGTALASTDRIATFLGAPAPADDAERAARVLSSAFAAGERPTNGDRTGGDAGSMAGAPARPASKDLSLDAVFGAPEASEPAPATFSFDQFFSQRATSEGSTGAAGGGGQESRDDVAKFTQWLEGLKQR